MSMDFFLLRLKMPELNETIEYINKNHIHYDNMAVSYAVGGNKKKHL